jgi:hypothetical protein
LVDSSLAGSVLFPAPLEGDEMSESMDGLGLEEVN